jgi:hypothetical protein
LESKPALNRFQTGNLSALRELALLWLAATLASHPQRHRPSGHEPGSGHVRERPGPFGTGELEVNYLPDPVSHLT